MGADARSLQPLARQTVPTADSIRAAEREDAIRREEMEIFALEQIEKDREAEVRPMTPLLVRRIFTLCVSDRIRPSPYPKAQGAKRNASAPEPLVDGQSRPPERDFDFPTTSNEASSTEPRLSQTPFSQCSPNSRVPASSASKTSKPVSAAGCPVPNYTNKVIACENHAQHYASSDGQDSCCFPEAKRDGGVDRRPRRYCRTSLPRGSFFF